MLIASIGILSPSVTQAAKGLRSVSSTYDVLSPVTSCSHYEIDSSKVSRLSLALWCKTITKATIVWRSCSVRADSALWKSAFYREVWRWVIDFRRREQNRWRHRRNFLCSG